MKMRWTLLAAAATIGLAACGNDAVADRDDPIQNLSEMVETPGDWSLLNVLVDRPPAESELLRQSPIMRAATNRGQPAVRPIPSKNISAFRHGHNNWLRCRRLTGALQLSTDTDDSCAKKRDRRSCCFDLVIGNAVALSSKA